MTRAVTLFKIWLSLLFLMPSLVSASDEVTLFDGAGNAVAYIALDDEMTIYMWTGKPVAYLTSDSQGGYHVYGFNGQHLGWFLQGVVWGPDGNASCAVKDALASTKFEPYKGYKQYKPFKSFRQFAPFRPHLSNSFGDIPCRFLLSEGGK